MITTKHTKHTKNFHQPSLWYSVSCFCVFGVFRGEEFPISRAL